VSKNRIIVIGTSAGGLEILNKLIQQFPENLPAAVFVVIHMAATSSADFVVKQMRKVTRNTCKVATNKELIQPGHIYLAPADHHLLISGNYMLVNQGPRENQFRPSIDPLFRSAAASSGASVIGIILTGMLQDGTVGMEAIKRSGGIAIVQDPEEAQFPEMPLSVLRNITVDYTVPVLEMGELVGKLLQEEVRSTTKIPEDIKLEARIAERIMGTTEEVEKLGEKVPYTCPDCGGNLWEIKYGSVLRYRCHLGHAFNADALMKNMNEAMEETLWVALRMMEERKNLLTTIIGKQEEAASEGWAVAQRERLDDMKVHINRIREILLGSEKLENPNT
jgi:two-component system chemotaxis response regulator CheB